MRKKVYWNIFVKSLSTWFEFFLLLCIIWQVRQMELKEVPPQITRGARELSTSQEAWKHRGTESHSREEPEESRRKRNAHSRKQTLLRQESWKAPSGSPGASVRRGATQALQGHENATQTWETVRGKEGDVSEETLPRSIPQQNG